ncbi:hypothetical protein B0H14DRAFT_491486 [Mycena olivaceomarginata]|nr:hypothetical protein B0H14DRAFT_491486 [Mycena olivaceomarginata]
MHAAYQPCKPAPHNECSNTRYATRHRGPGPFTHHPPSFSSVSPGGRQPPNTTPAKSRKVERTDDSSFARTQRHLRSPEDRIATRKSSLPSSSALNADDDPFSLGYQLAHRQRAASSLTPRPPWHSPRTKSSKKENSPGHSTTSYPTGSGDTSA